MRTRALPGSNSYSQDNLSGEEGHELPKAQDDADVRKDEAGGHAGQEDVASPLVCVPSIVRAPGDVGMDTRLDGIRAHDQRSSAAETRLSWIREEEGESADS